MRTSESIAKISPALLSAQKAIGGASKGAVNPFFKNSQSGGKYADLGAVIEAVKESLNENGITFLQSIDGHGVETVLLHESGEYVSSFTPIISSKENDPQAFGSAVTYAKRYGLQAFLGVPSEDDDGEKAMDRKQADKPHIARAKVVDEKPTPTATETKRPPAGVKIDMTKTIMERIKTQHGQDFLLHDYPDVEGAMGYINDGYNMDPDQEDDLRKFVLGLYDGAK